MTENEPDITVRINLYPEESEIKALRQIGVGLQPFVLLEGEPDEDGELVLVVTGSLIDSLEQLLEMIELFADSVRLAIENQESEL